MQRHLDPERGRYLPAVTSEAFLLRVGEPLGEGLQRLSVSQLESAVHSLRDRGDDVDEAVHEARKALKRLRAILRLVRAEIGDKAYRYENRTLRDAGRLISEVRASAVTVETVTGLAARFEGSLPIDVFDDLGERLDERALRIRRRVIHESDAVDRVIATLERARARFSGWPVGETEKRVYGSAIRNSYKAIAPGLEQTYGRGRGEMKQALRRPTARNFHLWRKRVKYLRHQVELLYPLWPEVMDANAAALDRLGAILGEEHDLAELLSLLSVNPDLCPDAVDRALFAALAQHRRAELQRAAQILGTRVYAEKPGRFVARIGSYWDATRIPIDVGMMIEA
ncbi:MAG: CHAD domain-containing protein [Acidimicrobiia bacterium]